MSGDPEQVYFIDGLVEDITTALSCIRSLFVIARNSAFAPSGAARSMSARSTAATLCPLRDGRQRSPCRQSAACHRAVDRCGLRRPGLGRALRSRRQRYLCRTRRDRDESRRGHRARIGRRRAATRAAQAAGTARCHWEAYQRGLWHFYKYAPEENKTALAFFRQAIVLDPNFAPGHYGYALALQWDIWHFLDAFLPGGSRNGPWRRRTSGCRLDDKDATAHAASWRIS